MTEQTDKVSQAIRDLGDTANKIIDGYQQKLADCRADRERMRDALEHIANVCKGSRQYTRRTRWIEVRCRSAIEGNEEWSTIDLPKHDPLVERLNTMIASIWDIVLSEQRRSRDALEAAALDRFIRDARHNIELVRNLEKQHAERQR